MHFIGVHVRTPAPKRANGLEQPRVFLLVLAATNQISPRCLSIYACFFKALFSATHAVTVTALIRLLCICPPGHKPSAKENKITFLAYGIALKRFNISER